MIGSVGISGLAFHDDHTVAKATAAHIT
ncbi:hypothetical protein AB4144_22675 [Rhizobiaceae sp. 2RAB30]